MKIACLGWGSLVWKGDEYPCVPLDSWETDGPMLPIEFSRVSQKSKLVTLVIDPMSEPVSILWCLLDSDNLEKSIESLSAREGTPKHNISYVSSSQNVSDVIQETVQKWLKLKKFDAAIWTGLSCRNAQGDNVRPSLDEVIKYLEGLDTEIKDRAKEYVIKAPLQIDTVYRKEMVKTFDWHG